MKLTEIKALLQRGNELNEIQWVADIDVYTAASVELMKLMKLIAAAMRKPHNKWN